MTETGKGPAATLVQLTLKSLTVRKLGSHGYWLKSGVNAISLDVLPTCFILKTTLAHPNEKRTNSLLYGTSNIHVTPGVTLLVRVTVNEQSDRPKSRIRHGVDQVMDASCTHQSKSGGGRIEMSFYPLTRHCKIQYSALLSFTHLHQNQQQQ